MPGLLNEDWRQRLRGLLAPNMVADPSLPELQNSHGGSFVTGLLGSAQSAATLPGDVYAGRVDPRSDEGIQRATDLAGLAMTGGVAGAGPGGFAVGSGPTFQDLLKGWSAAERGGGAARPTVPVNAAAEPIGEARARRLVYEDEVPSVPQPQTRGTPEAAGFDPGTYYHGLPSRTEVQPFSFRDPSGKDEAAIFLASDPSVAARYGETTMPLKARFGNTREVNWPDEVRRITNVEGYDKYDPHTMETLIREAREAGHDSLKIRNVADAGGPQDQFLVFNPNQLRSPWAAFDPALKDSPYLMGGLAGLAAFPYGLLNSREGQ